MKNFYLPILFLMGFLSPAFGVDKYENSRAKELRSKLVQCKDHVNYDSTDCYRAIDIELELERQQRLPDDQRSLFATSGVDLLIERANNLRMGIFVSGKGKGKLREFRVADGGVQYGFILGAAEGCEESNFSVLRNSPQFSFFVVSCFYKSKRGSAMSLHDYLMYDKEFKSVFTLAQSERAYIPNPSLELRRGVYQYRWNYVEESGRAVEMFYDFRVKSEVEAQCSRTWNEDCPIGPLERRIYSK
ncbi:hypothetical protein [Noviherbaspirillum cavernae]|nr:hypothetical protein [Noviherbaspirillum cavernae]